MQFFIVQEIGSEKLVKKIIVVIFISILIGITVAKYTNQATQDKTLAQEIKTLFENGESQIDLRSITNFEWTQVGVFEPYTSNESMEESMDIQFKGDNGGIDMLDDRFLLVFANETHATKTVVLSRKHGDYTLKENNILLLVP